MNKVFLMVAVFVSALAIVPAFLLVSAVVSMIEGDPIHFDILLSGVRLKMSVAAVAILFLGVPLHLLLDSRRQYRLCWYLVAGLAIPFIAITVAGLAFLGNDLASVTSAAIPLAVVGGLVATTFWFIAVFCFRLISR